MSVIEGSSIAMMVIRENGLLMIRNPAADRLFASRPARAMPDAGQFLQDFEPQAFFAERVAFIQRLVRTDEDGVMRDIWQGEQVIEHLRVLPATDGEPLRSVLGIYLSAHGPQHAEDYEGSLFVDGVEQDLGMLALLSPRELEVLALVGEGLTTAQMAERIHRTEDTVHSHRAALLRKLGCQNAVQLGTIAQRAGLKFNNGLRQNA